MKNQVLFSLKDKSKKLKCRLLPFLCGDLRVNSVLRKSHNTGYCKVLSIGADRSEQTVQTLIRLLHLEQEQTGQDLHCFPVHLHLLDAILQCKTILV